MGGASEEHRLEVGVYDAKGEKELSALSCLVQRNRLDGTRKNSKESWSRDRKNLESGDVAGSIGSLSGSLRLFKALEVLKGLLSLVCRN